MNVTILCRDGMPVSSLLVMLGYLTATSFFYALDKKSLNSTFNGAPLDQMWWRNLCKEQRCPKQTWTSQLTRKDEAKTHSKSLSLSQSPMCATYWDSMLGFKSIVAISPISVYEAKH